jgi:transcriptional regulator with XRE-family HTH domain
VHRYRLDGVELKRRRLLSGKKPELLALSLGITKETYIGYEQERITPTAKRLFALCDELDCRADDVMLPVDPEPQAVP